MRISVEEAEDRLEELVQRAEAGEEILLTLQGRVAARFEAVQRQAGKPRRALINSLQRSVAVKVTADSQDFFCDEEGLSN